MKLIQLNPLNQNKFTKVDDADYDFLMQWKWTYHKGKGNRTGYAKRFEYIKGSFSKQNKWGKKKSIQLHREILGLKLGDGKIADHINHDGLDNQRHNLRACNSKENSRNRLSCVNATSKFIGVHLVRVMPIKKHTTVDGIEKIYSGKKYIYWGARIQYEGKSELIGNFKSEVDAAIAWDARAKVVYGEFANLNNA